MPRKKKKSSEEGKSLDITAFLGGGPQPPRGEGAAGGAEAGGAISAPPLLDETVDLIYNYISGFPGGVGKSELYKWAKSKGVKPADLYRAILQLVSQGKIKRVFDPEKEEYVYVATS